MKESKQKFNFEIHDGEIHEEDVKIEYIESTAFPTIPVKPLVAALLLTICGSVLLIMGFVEEYTNFSEPSRGIAFWVLSAITLTPGLYFTVQFYRAYRARTPAERSEILRNIPEMN